MNDLSFDSLFADATIDIDCPVCEKSFDIQLSQIGTAVRCPHCSAEINLEKDENFDSVVESVDSSLKDLDETLNNF